MLRIAIFSVILILNIVLQATFFKTIAITNISPNLLLITTVSFALLRGRRSGMIIGFCLGLLQDIFFGPVIGFYALLYMYIGFFCGYFTKSFYRDSLLIPVSIIGASGFACNFLIYLFTYLFRGRTDMFHYFTTITVPEVTYTVLIAIFIYKLYFFINVKIEHYEANKRGSDVI